jgi:hypothetical protein
MFASLKWLNLIRQSRTAGRREYGQADNVDALFRVLRKRATLRLGHKVLSLIDLRRKTGWVS